MEKKVQKMICDEMSDICKMLTDVVEKKSQKKELLRRSDIFKKLGTKPKSE